MLIVFIQFIFYSNLVIVYSFQKYNFIKLFEIVFLIYTFEITKCLFDTFHFLAKRIINNQIAIYFIINYKNIIKRCWARCE